MKEQDRNLSQIRAYTAAFNNHDIASALDFFASDTSNYGRQVGRAGVGMVLKDIFTRFPDVSLKDLDVVAVDNQVICRGTYSGSHLGVGTLPIDGGQMVGVAPTGKHFSVQHIHWYTLRGGVIVEHRACRDDVGMLVQLGLLPEPPPFSAPRT